MIHFDNLSDNLLMVSFCLRVYREEVIPNEGIDFILSVSIADHNF